MIIDIFCHLVSETVSRIAGGAENYEEGTKAPPQNADPEARLKLMDRHGVNIQALSQTAPILHGLNAEGAAEICRISNNDNFALCKAYPDRFVNICILSLLDASRAMKELNRCINELDCRGITIASNQNGKGLDSEEYFPFYEKLVERDLPLFIHPTNWGSYPLVDNDTGWRMMHVFGWPFDTTQAVWRLVYGGVIDRYPSLKVVTHHCGAMLPYFARRMEGIGNALLKGRLPRPIVQYWSNFYGDTALSGTVAAYACGYAFFGPDRMVFGTDYPYGADAGEGNVRANLAGVKAMDIPPEAMRKILGENARKLLKIT